MPELELRLVSIADAAPLLGIGRSKAYELAREGRLPMVDLDGRNWSRSLLSTSPSLSSTRDAV